MTTTRPTVADLRTAVSGILTSLNLDRVSDLNGKFERAAGNLVQKANVPEMMSKQAYFFYDGVYDYPSPDNIFGSAVVDIAPQGVTRSNQDYASKQYIADFDRGKAYVVSGINVTFLSAGGIDIMRIAQTKATAKTNIDTMSDTTGWVASGNANGLALDSTVYYQEPGALRFNLAAGGTQGILTKTLTNALNLSTYAGVAMVFLAVQMPDVTSITSVELRLGSSNANYWSRTVTQGFLGAFRVNDFFLLAFDLALATTVGTPNAAAINYVELLLNYSNANIVPNVRVGGLWAALPSPYEVLTQTTAIFIPAASTTNTPQTSIAMNTDTIILNPASFNIYAYECAREVAFGKGGTASSGVTAGIDRILLGSGSELGLYQRYRGDNPSQELRTVGSYYSIRRRG